MAFDLLPLKGKHALKQCGQVSRICRVISLRTFSISSLKQLCTAGHPNINPESTANFVHISKCLVLLGSSSHAEQSAVTKAIFLVTCNPFFRNF